MKDALATLGLPMVVLTNASRGWATRTIAHLELDDLFKPESVFCLEDMAYQTKAGSAEGYKRCLSILDVPAENVLMVEDLAKNLPMAKSLGMTTALVHHGQIPEDMTSYVDLLFENTIDLARALGVSRVRSGN